MSRDQPRQMIQGSRRWYARTMRDWALSIGKGVPKNQRRSMKGAAAMGLYDPLFTRGDRYDLTYKQQDQIDRVHRATVRCPECGSVLVNRLCPRCDA